MIEQTSDRRVKVGKTCLVNVQKSKETMPSTHTPELYGWGTTALPAESKPPSEAPPRILPWAWAQSPSPLPLVTSSWPDVAACASVSLTRGHTPRFLCERGWEESIWTTQTPGRNALQIHRDSSCWSSMQGRLLVQSHQPAKSEASSPAQQLPDTPNLRLHTFTDANVLHQHQVCVELSLPSISCCWRSSRPATPASSTCSRQWLFSPVRWAPGPCASCGSLLLKACYYNFKSACFIFCVFFMHYLCKK